MKPTSSLLATTALILELIASVESYGSPFLPQRNMQSHAFSIHPTESFQKARVASNGRSQNRKAKHDNLVMFKDESGNSNKNDTPISTNTQTQLGNLVVPSVGIGTISWSSNSLTTLENLELQSVMNEACKSNAAFFDTAERYGSHMKTALGLGYGETELLLQKLRNRCPHYLEEQTPTSPIIATKFTPTPWRTTVDSVVEACEQSRQRLGVDQIDLYQLHMPDIVQPLRFLGLGKPKDEIYWKGLAECHRLGLVKNVGVSNYGPTLVRFFSHH